MCLFIYFAVHRQSQRPPGRRVDGHGRRELQQSLRGKRKPSQDIIIQHHPSVSHLVHSHRPPAYVTTIKGTISKQLDSMNLPPTRPPSPPTVFTVYLPYSMGLFEQPAKSLAGARSQERLSCTDVAGWKVKVSIQGPHWYWWRLWWKWEVGGWGGGGLSWSRLNVIWMWPTEKGQCGDSQRSQSTKRTEECLQGAFRLGMVLMRFENRFWDRKAMVGKCLSSADRRDAWWSKWTRPFSCGFWSVMTPARHYLSIWNHCPGNAHMQQWKYQYICYFRYTVGHEPLEYFALA